jgi:hypothetical protein
VDKVGPFSGWTFGYVANTCAIIEFDPTHDLLCQVTANYGSREGDSGAPVFIWYNDNTVYIAGVHAGRGGSGNAFFSKFVEIAWDLGVSGDLTVW